MLTLGSFFLAAAIWTPIIASHFGSVRETQTSIIWVATVFGTWMVILVPLIIVMYQKVDKAYEDARLRRERAANQFRSIFVEPEKRKLSDKLRQKICQTPPTIEGGHLVDVILKSGRRIPHVFVSHANEIIGIYGAEAMDFDGQDVDDVFIDNLSNPPAFKTSRWLRLDGVQPPE